MDVSKPRLLLRVDVSREHGTGHLMRCKALADAWMASGGEAEFATCSDLAPYREWLGVLPAHHIAAAGGSDEDADETIALATARGASWVAADGYHFGPSWQSGFGQRQRLLLFDDYGHGAPHSAHFVLNQNPSATAALYARRSPGVRLLLGPGYALLRDQFLSWRGWKRQVPARAARLLVTFGGTDPAGMTLRVIEPLLALRDLEVEIVVGAGNPNAADIEARCAGTHIHVRRNVTEMPALIASCDFALCAAGTTTLECAFLQTPQILVAVADNQRALAASLETSGAAEHLGWHTEISDEAILEAVLRLRDSEPRRTAMSVAAGRLVDGLGGERVVAQLRAGSLGLRAMGPDDSRLAWEWANDPGTRAASFSSEPIPWEEHDAWFSQRLADPNTAIWLGIENPTVNPATQLLHPEVGLVRFALEGDEATISVVISPARRGGGYGAALILRASQHLLATRDITRIHAYIKPANPSSLRAFAKAGYQQTLPTDIRGVASEHFILDRATIPRDELALT